MAKRRPSAGRVPWVCPVCRKKEVRQATIPYHAERLYSGQLIAVDIPNLEVPKCDNCGELVFNYRADEQILEAVRSQAHLTEQHTA